MLQVSFCKRTTNSRALLRKLTYIYELIALAKGWRRCMGCRELQVSFRKRTTNYMALLRKQTYICEVIAVSTGWRRCMGYLKLQVSFHKRTNIYKALLRKRTYICEFIAVATGRKRSKVSGTSLSANAPLFMGFFYENWPTLSSAIAVAKESDNA